jgi:tetratricopeptide (TPR) repeat protein
LGVSGPDKEYPTVATQSQFQPWHIAWFLVLCLLASPLAKAQRPSGQSRQSDLENLGAITIRVQSSDGTPYEGTALVNLYNFAGSLVGVGTAQTREVQFNNLGIGQYRVEVTALGYKKLSQTVEVSFPGQNQYTYITLVPESSDEASTPSSTAPLLAPNAQKDLNRALEAIRQAKPKEARKYLEKLSRSAPGNPDVNYLWGVYYFANNDWSQAKSYWEKAVQIYPRHAFSLSALAQIAVHDGDLPSAISCLSKATEAEPSSWRFEEQLANAYLRHKEYDQAQTHSEHAIELGKDRAAGARLILAQALVQRDDKPRAVKTLQSFVEAQPNDSHAAAARQMIALLQKVEPSAPATAPLETRPPSATAAALAADLAPPPKWMPPDVDESMPVVEPGVACPLQKVQDESGKRVHDFIDSVNKITATEKLENELLDQSGFPSLRESRSFSYVVDIQEVRKGVLNVEEYRNGTVDPGLFPQQIATKGLPALVLIFHPDYTNDFEISCEGLSRWRGGLAWQVHFRQRSDKPSRLRQYRTGGRLTLVSLRGRAWIAADTFQVVRLEADIVSPLPQIRLKAEHVSVDYAPVAFRKRNQKLWLPQTAELYFDYKGRRMHRRHRFSNYLLFAVDEKEKISDPEIPADGDQPGALSPDNS